jgi:hypothetical protein
MARHGHAALNRASATDLDEVAHALCEPPAVVAVASRPLAHVCAEDDWVGVTPRRAPR